MQIEVEFRSSVPLNEQIARQVMALIKEGELKAGDQLPTTRELAVKLGINFNTVARAYRTLDQAGIISTQPGRGTFILDPDAGQLPEGSKAEHIKELTRHYISQATYLGYKPDEIRECIEEMVEEERE